MEDRIAQDNAPATAERLYFFYMTSVDGKWY